jgi:hypothetical protein
MNILIVFGGVATVAGGLGAVGLSLPQIATKDEVTAVAESSAERIERLAGDVREIKRQQILDDMRLNRQLRYDNLAEQEKYKGRGEPVPALITRDWIALEEEAQQLERDLNRLDK